MEDVLVFEDMMSKYPNDRKKAFEEYSKFRNPDAEAICDLAMYNYIEVKWVYNLHLKHLKKQKQLQCFFSDERFNSKN